MEGKQTSKASRAAGESDFMEQERKRHEESKRKLKTRYEELDDEDKEGS